ncbi:hypothetical protein VitviT2T_014790 [Vitis vinifera]|uniref:X8 domain-containing protein n=1 Tax=Vitis vinifera TaxID=29760 RepID=A0ABY9CN85_VITVI|nr:hypothetical protein VitviT2T_014790 [Vitis vinifera]
MSSAMLRIVIALLFFTLVLQNSNGADWCVARPDAPEAELQKGMDYACQFGQTCSHLRPGESCYLPNTVKDHASYAYNSYYQTHKFGPEGGKACYFNGTGMYVYSDPRRKNNVSYHDQDGLSSATRHIDGEEWCIANSTCPDPVLQHGLNWACANGADCDKTLPGQPCFLPNSLKDHASYAYNSYYKKFKTQGATCNFAYSGILTNVDPSNG